MLILHPYKEACTTQILLKSEEEQVKPARDLLALLYGVSNWLGISPAIYHSPKATAVYVLYRNAALVLSEFWDCFAYTMAQINRSWLICAFGTTEDQDSVRLSSELDNNILRLSQQTVSGESTEVVRTLCFQTDCSDSDTADRLMDCLERMNWQTGIAAISWQRQVFAREQMLMLMPDARSYFCYVGTAKGITAGDLLDSLNFSQKAQLWTAFLREGFNPAEFEWLADAISGGSLDNRMEWELALREAMDQLKFRIINQDKDFEIYNGAGQRCYFGADIRHPAEWVFLKILFPLNC